MALRRGFKKEANSIAREIRRELKLHPVAPLNPWDLASHLEIPVLTLTSMSESAPFAVHHFSSVGSSEFSAVTVFRGYRRVIIHNDSHSKGRQASDLAHELSHGLLLHPPTPALNDCGCRDWDQDLEDEAEWLSGALLISEEAALHIVRRQLTTEEAAASYGVSGMMVQWRLNVTGARRRIERAQQRRKPSGFYAKGH